MGFGTITENTGRKPESFLRHKTRKEWDNAFKILMRDGCRFK